VKCSVTLPGNTPDSASIQVREYGSSGPPVVLLHGGPGAAGYMAPVARQLADSLRVLEPLQRRREDEPLTVARHVADLNGVVQSCAGPTRPALVGHFWGAMLALACAAAHPDTVGALVLIGCGTFDTASRDRSDVPHLEYREWERCGHYPWLEKAVRDEFFDVLRDWLTRRSA